MCIDVDATNPKTITVNIQSNGIIRQRDGVLIGKLPDDIKFEEIQTGDEIANAVKLVTKAIKNDPDLYLVYQANIAMAFKDEFDRSFKRYKSKQGIHEIANTAAKNFLNSWIR